MSHKTKIFFDTEFVENGGPIYPLSIGLIREDGAALYHQTIAGSLLAEGYKKVHTLDSIVIRPNQWVLENVVPKLEKGHGLPEQQIKEEILTFCGPSPSFYAYYSAYDWVVLCQLFGRMIDLPKHWPMYCRDIKYLLDLCGNPDVSHIPNENEHHALHDAMWDRDVFNYIEENYTLLAHDRFVDVEPWGDG